MKDPRKEMQNKLELLSFSTASPALSDRIYITGKKKGLKTAYFNAKKQKRKAW